MAKLERDPDKITDPQRFYDRAKELTDKFRSQMLSFSTAIIAGLVYFQLNRITETSVVDTIFFISSLAFFGASIWLGILSFKWESSKNYFLGEMNNPKCNTDYHVAKNKKDYFDKKNLQARNAIYVLFLIGITMALGWLIQLIFI